MVQAVLHKVGPHLPASAPAVKPPAAMQAALVQLNLAAAKLGARVLPLRQAADQDGEQGWRGRMLDYYIGIMAAGQVLPSG